MRGSASHQSFSRIWARCDWRSSRRPQRLRRPRSHRQRTLRHRLRRRVTLRLRQPSRRRARLPPRKRRSPVSIHSRQSRSTHCRSCLVVVALPRLPLRKPRPLRWRLNARLRLHVPHRAAASHARPPFHSMTTPTRNPHRSDRGSRAMPNPSRPRSRKPQKLRRSRRARRPSRTRMIIRSRRPFGQPCGRVRPRIEAAVTRAIRAGRSWSRTADTRPVTARVF